MKCLICADTPSSKGQPFRRCQSHAYILGFILFEKPLTTFSQTNLGVALLFKDITQAFNHAFRLNKNDKIYFLTSLFTQVNFTRGVYKNTFFHVMITKVILLSLQLFAGTYRFDKETSCYLFIIM